MDNLICALPFAYTLDDCLSERLGAKMGSVEIWAGRSGHLDSVRTMDVVAERVSLATTCVRQVHWATGQNGADSLPRLPWTVHSASIVEP